MNDYTKKLITEELGFGELIEQQLKKIQQQKEAEEEEYAELSGGDDNEELHFDHDDEDDADWFREELSHPDFGGEE